MRRRTMLVAVLVGATGHAQERPQPTEATSVDAGRRPQASAQGASTVRGGDTLELDGARVVIDHVSYIDQKCPPNARCVHSGVIKLVHFRVIRSGAPQTVAIPEGANRVVDGVELRVTQVRAGPEADVEARLSP